MSLFNLQDLDIFFLTDKSTKHTVTELEMTKGKSF